MLTASPEMMAAARASLEARAARLRRERRFKAAEEVEKLIAKSWEISADFVADSAPLPNPQALPTPPAPSAIEQQLGGLRTQLEVLGLRADAALLMKYEFILDEGVRKQLRADNARMENSLLKIAGNKKDPLDPNEHYFRRFCLFAFFQIEEMLNYYYYYKFSDFGDLKADFLQTRKVPLKYLGDQVVSVRDLTAYTKIMAYKNEFASTAPKKQLLILDKIREARNLEEHRCSVILQEPNVSDVEAAYFSLMEKVNNMAKNGLSYTKSKKEFEIEEEYYFLQFFRERRVQLVRDQLALMESNISGGLEPYT